jgi:anti-sigma B factor antagonist
VHGIDDVSVERPEPGKAVVVFSGEHDLTQRDDVSRLLEDLVDENRLVVVDFADATFVDSTVMHILLDADMAARRRGGTLRIQLGTNAIVVRAFELIGLGARLDVVPSREEALADPSA